MVIVKKRWEQKHDIHEINAGFEETMEIRDAEAGDMEGIRATYNDVLTSSTAIYNDNPATRAERLAWWRGRVERGFPVIVAVNEERLLGFATVGEFRSGSGYRFTVEVTVHVDREARGQGVGTALVGELVERTRRMGKHVMVAGVDAENATSLRFLERLGFERVGTLPEVGYKFGQYLNLVFLQYWITPPVLPR